MAIIESLLDIDFYKFLMGQFVFHGKPRVPVEYQMMCRNPGINPLEHIPEPVLRQELDHARSLTFKEDELEYLAGIKNSLGRRVFKEGYINFLRNYRLPPYRLERKDGEPILSFYGLWPESIYWETIALSIVNELYYRHTLTEDDYNYCLNYQGPDIVKNKARRLRQWKGIKVSDFGTRRRFSREWHTRALAELYSKIGDQLTGTSNVWLARRFRLTPVGTMAHEVFMVYSCLRRDSIASLRDSQIEVLDGWWEKYGHDYSVLLPDTYGAEFVLQNIPYEHAALWKGFRHDSGDPVEFGKRVIDFYWNLNILPKAKTIIFSDGLTIGRMFKIWRTLAKDINIGFGWGTNFTNDMGDLAKPLSLVVKPVRAAGESTVKFSDNRAKALGPERDIAMHEKAFGSLTQNYSKLKY